MRSSTENTNGKREIINWVLVVLHHLYSRRAAENRPKTETENQNTPAATQLASEQPTNAKWQRVHQRYPLDH